MFEKLRRKTLRVSDGAVVIIGNPHQRKKPQTVTIIENGQRRVFVDASWTPPQEVLAR